MNAQTHLTNNTYVAAYQSEVKADLQAARTTTELLQAFRRYTDRWLARTKARRTSGAGVRSVDGASSAGACEIPKRLDLAT